MEYLLLSRNLREKIFIFDCKTISARNSIKFCVLSNHLINQSITIFLSEHSRARMCRVSVNSVEATLGKTY